MRIIWTILKNLRKFWLYKILHLETHGVRVALLRKNSDVDEILLIKHPYDSFWVFPGGGINKQESPKNAALREISEETKYEITDTNNLQKLGEYRNNSGSKNDHVTMYVSRDFREQPTLNKSTIDKLEIEKEKWFSLNNLPEISSATEHRIEEIINNELSEVVREW